MAALITRQALEVLAPIVSAPEARVTRQAIEVLAPIVSAPEARITRQVIEVIASVAVVVSQGDGTTVSDMYGFGELSTDSVELLTQGWTAAGGTLAAAQGRFAGVGYSLVAGAVLATLKGSIATQPRRGATYWAKWPVITGNSVIYHLSGDTITGTMPSTTTAHTAVQLNSDGSLELFAANVSIGTTAAGLIVAGTYHHIEVRTFLDAVGSVELWVDANSELSSTGVNTIFGANVADVSMQFGSGTSAEMFMDDLLLAHTSVAPMGLHQIHEVIATTAGTNDAWTGTVADIDDPAGAPDDNTYVSTQVGGTLQDANFGDIGLTETVWAVDVNARARVNEGGLLTLSQYVISGAFTHTFGAETLTDNYVLYSSRLNQNPEGPIDWTPAAVNALIAGVTATDI